MKLLDPDKSFIINYAPLFAGLSTLEKNLISEKSKVVEFKKGDTIYKQYDSADALYCVITGRVRIFTLRENKKEILEYLNAGKYFGMISLLTGDLHSVNAEAANDSKILRIEKADFQLILDRIPKLAIDLSKTLSRRLRKKDIKEKRIFESNIISIFSAVGGIGRTMYGINLAMSLKKETAKDIILIDLSKNADEICSSLGLADYRIIALDRFPTESIVKEAMIKDPVSGISILNIRHDTANPIFSSHLNSILTQLTGDYHYIVVDLPALMDDVVFSALSQSDTIHIITDYNAINLVNTKKLIRELFQRVNYPQDKINVIINMARKGKSISDKEVYKLLEYKVYATLPTFGEPEEKIVKVPSVRIVLDYPQTEYAKAIRRIARELGDVRVGLALGGGAALGLAHIGVIKVLEKEHIPIDMITGTSMGALIGALWASGLNSQELEKIALEYNHNKKKVLRLLFDPCFPKLSFVQGKRIRGLLERHLDKKTFRDIKIPLKIIACNLSKRQEFIFESGSLIDAVMASIAIPGVFRPARRDGDLLVDGGIIQPVSTGTLIKMGIKKIIAVNTVPSPEDIAKSYESNLLLKDEEESKAKAKGFFAQMSYQLRVNFKKLFFPNILDIIVNSIQTMEYRIAESECQRADIILRPTLAGVNWFELFKAQELIKKGEEEATRLLPEIRSLIQE